MDTHILSDEQCRGNDHIPTSTIEKDIIDTKLEVNSYQRELDILRENPSENKLKIYMLEGSISKRQIFISRLNSILEYRKKNNIIN